MDVEVVGKFLSTLPEDDDHPYRTGPWRPQTTEWRADDLPTVEGEFPSDLDGVYLRNTENPLHPALKFYHPFDGDGMIHVVGFRDGKAFYRNRFIRTEGFLAENEAGRPLWAGLAEPPKLAERDGWGARGRMKDASSTDVIVHRGTALTSFYQCGDLYRVDPFSAETLGKETWNGRFPFDWGVSAHPKVDLATGELLFFNYSKQAPYMHYGVVDERGELVHYVDIPLPGPRLPHDMAFTRNYAILNDFPLFWDPELLKKDVHAARFHPDMPSRFAVIPRAAADDIRWFEAEPTYVLHFANAYEDGDEIVLDGFFQGDPEPADNGKGDKWQRAFRFLALDRMQARLHRWRLNLVTGAVREEQTVGQHHRIRDDQQRFRRRAYRYTYAATGKPGWFSVRRSGQARPAHRRRGTLLVRRRRLRQRDRDGAAGGECGRGRRLPRHAHHRHERRCVLLPGVRRSPGNRRSGMQTSTPGTDFQRHAFHVGSRLGAKALAQRLALARRQPHHPVVAAVGDVDVAFGVHRDPQGDVESG